MVVFDVFVNGEPRCRAGVTGGVLTAILTYVSPSDHHGKPRPETFDLRVGGLEDPDEHLDWLVESLRRGDRITVESSEADNADEPQARKRPPRPDPATPRAAGRQAVETMNVRRNRSACTRHVRVHPRFCRGSHSTRTCRRVRSRCRAGQFRRKRGSS